MSTKGVSVNVPIKQGLTVLSYSVFCFEPTMLLVQFPQIILKQCQMSYMTGINRESGCS